MMKSQEFEAFSSARNAIENGEKVSENIAIMLKLAFEAQNLTLRAWAANFMMKIFNVEIGSAEDETTAKASRL
ncbi:hypothetical protein BSL82_15845 [Tardibacter chloracetimidivorans]|uniref:Uncharacterized protein n=1 Tax=Tardibacter chloracetimidivorans TaxID=1921510 RepID=A0A1L3ZY64_9SPHN|nr:hypothetical protein [Tardibacter chloracetimidivorans]API60578.1 hypothetical protein BSL82_15845 [Tardibacter chloracetimidivorans]